MNETIWSCIYLDTKRNIWRAEIKIKNTPKRYLGGYPDKARAINAVDLIKNIINSGFGTTATEKRMITLFKNKENLRTISEIVGFNRPTIFWLLQKNNIDIYKDYLSIDPEILKGLVEQGKNITQISEISGLTHETVTKLLKKNGLYKHSGHDPTNFLNKKFGNLFILEFIGKRQMLDESKKRTSHSFLYKAICDCGKTKEVTSNQLLHGTTRCYHEEYAPRGPKNLKWKGFGLISGTLWGSIRRGAKSRNLDFEISMEYAWNLFLSQDGKCALTGAPINFPETSKSKSTASLDRIDSFKGYVDGNCQWVHKGTNFLKSNIDNENFILFCNAVANKNPRENICLEAVAHSTVDRIFLKRLSTVNKEGKNFKGETFEVTSPTGEVFLIKNLMKFADENQIPYLALTCAASRKNPKIGEWFVKKILSF